MIKSFLYFKNINWIIKALFSVNMSFLLVTGALADGKITKKNLPILFSTPSSYKSATGNTISSYQEVLH